MLKLIRIRDVIDRLGSSRTAIYDRIEKGSLPPPVRVGPQNSAWPEHEIEQIVRAHIAGKGVDEIKTLVAELVQQRQQAA